MKIACKNTLLAHALLLSICFSLGIIARVEAADAAAPAAAEPAPSLPALQPPPIAPTTAANPTSSVASLENALPVPAAPKNTKPVDAIDTKVPDSVKEAIRKLDATDNLTLEDLNNARQAIAKIDALIEFEKKLNELDKLRQEHEGGGANAKPLAAAIPASAINALPPPSLPSFIPPAPLLPAASHTPEPPPSFGGGSGDISRIIGSGGRYAVVIKNGDQTKMIQVGDHFDGGTVSSISATSVQIDEGKTTRTLHVKNIENVFGNAN